VSLFVPRSKPALIGLIVGLGLLAPALAQEGGGAALPPPVTGRDKPQKKELGTRQAANVGREGMWPAPTAADWAKPCLIRFERSWDDALAVAKETQKAILICISMDGEIASEHYAGKRYRDPEITALYEPYVCVIASVYRHTPRDYDDAGNRVLCPRFGSVTCGEHIAIEPIVYAKYLDEVRIAPRHIMVELDGSEVYDVYYANDTASVFDKIQDGVIERTTQPKTIIRGDRPVTERVGSRAIEDRVAVENAYHRGDKSLRKKLLDEALKNPDADPTDLLRLAVFGFDNDLGKQARAALAKADSPGAVNLISEALRVPMEGAERDALIAALERMGETSKKAWWLAVVNRGLDSSSTAVDVGGWTKAFAESAASGGSAGSGSYGGATADEPTDESAAAWMKLEREHALQIAACTSSPDLAEPRVERAIAALALARKARETFGGETRSGRAFRRHFMHDARDSALEAQKMGATDWRVSAVLSLADYYGSDVLRTERAAAYPHAEVAVKAMPPGQSDWNSVAVLTIFAESRFKAIKASVKKKEKWPPGWLTDLDAAYSVLLQHPLGTDVQIAWHYDFLVWLRAHRRSARVLDKGLARFPNSSVLHKKMRDRLVKWRGIDGLETAYTKMMAADDRGRDVPWFAGYASTVAGDFYRKAGNAPRAKEAYGRAVAYFDEAAASNPDAKDSSDRQAAFALAGQARMSYQLGDDEAAYTEILASFARFEAAAGARDGAGVTPVETAQMLLARLRDDDKTELVDSLFAALAELPPEYLLPDRP